MSGLKKHIYEEKNGLHYTLNGDYYLPDLKLPEEHRPIGKYGLVLCQDLVQVKMRFSSS